MAKKLPSDPHCPHCKTLLDGATHMGEEDIMPECGDVSLCNKCGELLEFDKDIQLIPIKSETIDQLDLRDIQKAQMYMKIANSMNPQV